MPFVRTRSSQAKLADFQYPRQWMACYASKCYQPPPSARPLTPLTSSPAPTRTQSSFPPKRHREAGIRSTVPLHLPSPSKGLPEPALVIPPMREGLYPLMWKAGLIFGQVTCGPSPTLEFKWPVRLYSLITYIVALSFSADLRFPVNFCRRNEIEEKPIPIIFHQYHRSSHIQKNDVLPYSGTKPRRTLRYT